MKVPLLLPSQMSLSSAKLTRTLAIFVSVLAVLISASNSYANTKVPLKDFCRQIAGQWQGSAASPNAEPKQVDTQVICSSDAKQLIFSVSSSSRFNTSETWWFKQKFQAIELDYSNGIDTEVRQIFTLYQRPERYTFVGKGEVNQRPALIQLMFIKQGTAQDSWLWQQSAHYLDDDSDSYKVIRTIELLPKLKPKP